MKQVSKIVDGVRCVIGQATKKPNTVTMTISGKFAIEAVEYFDALRKGEEITEGLIGLELIAHYAEDARPIDLEVKMDEITGTLEEATQLEIGDNNDHCESCGIVINEGDIYSLTADSCYLCKKCTDELPREEPDAN